MTRIFSRWGIILAASVLSLTPSWANCKRNGIDCSQPTVDSAGQTMSNIASLPELPTGTNTIGSVANTQFGSSQVGSWSINALDHIVNPVAVTGTFWQPVQPVSQSGSWNTSLNGLLPGYASTPTFDLGALNGAATDASVVSLGAKLGSPFQAGGSIGNTSFGASQVGSWNVGLTAGSAHIGSVGITGSVAVTGAFWQDTQPVSLTALPLPQGAAIASKQPQFTLAGTPSVDVLTVQGSPTGTALPISANALPLPAGAATSAGQTTTNTALEQIKTNTTGLATSAKQDTELASLATIALQTNGVATAARQDTGNGYLATIAASSGSGPTAAKQDAGNASLASIATNTAAGATANKQDTANVALATIAANTAGLATSAKQDTGNSALSSIVTNTTDVSTGTKQDVQSALLNTVSSKLPGFGTAGSASTNVVSVQGIASGTAVSVSASSLPLPSGAATSAAQDTGNASLSTIATNTTGVSTTAKQDAQTTVLNSILAKLPSLGTGGTPSTNVISIQGATGGTSISAVSSITPSTVSTIGITPTAGGPTTGQIFAGSAINVYGINVVNGTTAGFAVLYNAAAIPPDGALTASSILWCMPMAANSGIRESMLIPLRGTAGVVFFVSSTSCTTKAAVQYGYAGVMLR